MNDNDRMATSAALFAELDDLRAAAQRLPACDRAAKLHALVARVAEATRTGEQVAPAAEALVAAVTAALADDPWVQFEAAARAFHARVSSPGSSAADAVTSHSFDASRLNQQTVRN